MKVRFRGEKTSRRFRRATTFRRTGVKEIQEKRMRLHLLAALHPKPHVAVVVADGNESLEPEERKIET